MIINLGQKLGQIFGTDLNVRRVFPSELGLSLPALVERHYDFFVAMFSAQKEVLLARIKQRVPLRIVVGHYRLIRKQFSAPTIIYFDVLAARDRQQLVSAGIQFMVSDRFLFASDLGFFGENPLCHRLRRDFVEAKRLTPLAESILIGQLLDQRFHGKTGKMISEPLKSSAAAISQALAELERQDLVELVRRGKAKYINFEDRGKLWINAREILTNPIESESSVSSLPPSSIKAGLTALSELTMLADTDQPTYAVFRRTFNQTMKDEFERQILFNERKYRIQSWRRNPDLFAMQGRIDPISLYLSLRTFPDERVQKELMNLIREVGLEHA